MQFIVFSKYSRADHGDNLYRYLPPHHLNAQTLQHVGQDTSTEFVARSSSDPVLIAFAQLGTFRLDAQRTLISLFGRHEQHVLTEATRTLSLQGNPDNNACDALCFGSCTMSYGRSFCKSVLNASTSAQSTSDRVVIVPDLLLDDKFKEHPDVTGRPNIRFLACSPIISPKGFVIGSYTILDNKPHGPPNITILHVIMPIFLPNKMRRFAGNLDTQSPCMLGEVARYLVPADGRKGQGYSQSCPYCVNIQRKTISGPRKDLTSTYYTHKIARRFGVMKNGSNTRAANTLCRIHPHRP